MRRRSLDRHFIAPVILFAVVWTFFGLQQEQFATRGNIYAILSGWAFVGLVALGIGVTMLMGEIDLSAGSIAGLGGILAIQFSSLGLVLAVIAATAPLCVLGAAQGYIIHRLRINSAVFTLGTLIAISGIGYLASGDAPVSLSFEHLHFADEVSRRLFVFSPFILITMAAFAIVWLVLAYTRVGREVYALGGGRREALSAGVSTRKPFIGAFAFSAGAAGLAGSLSAFFSGGATPVGFGSILLLAVTAVCVGGVGVTGGVGSVLGIALGALIIQSLASGTAFNNYAAYIADLITGLLLFGVLALEVVINRVSRELKRRADAQPPPLASEGVS